MKIILTTLCLTLASMTVSYADAFAVKVLKNGKVIAFHSAQQTYGGVLHYYTVKYTNKIFWCELSRRELICKEMK
jgi:hypothetical protein